MSPSLHMLSMQFDHWLGIQEWGVHWRSKLEIFIFFYNTWHYYSVDCHVYIEEWQARGTEFQGMSPLHTLMKEDKKECTYSCLWADNSSEGLMMDRGWRQGSQWKKSGCRLYNCHHKAGWIGPHLLKYKTRKFKSVSQNLPHDIQYSNFIA